MIKEKEERVPRLKGKKEKGKRKGKRLPFLLGNLRAFIVDVLCKPPWFLRWFIVCNHDLDMLYEVIFFN